MSTRFAFFSAEDFGRTIAEGRRISGLTQQQLANEVGVDRTYLSRLEQGRPSIQLEHLFRLLQRLGIRIEGSMDDPSEPTPRGVDVWNTGGHSGAG